MVFGFLKGGKMSITLPKLNYTNGETINGTVILDLSKPKKARAVKIRIFAIRQNRSMSSKGSSTSNQTIFDFSQNLDIEKEYPAGKKEYQFQIQVPAKNKIEVEGGVGNALKAISALGNMMSPTYWYLETKLDIAGAMDINNKIQINVSEQ